MTASIDLNVRAFAFRRAEITGVGTWLHMDGGRVRPCMALLRAGEELNQGITPYIITSDRAWIWSEEIGDPHESAQQCFRIAEALRLNPDQATIFKIFAFVHDHLGDLLSIPPFPPAAAPANAIAEVTVTNRQTGATHEVVLTDV